MKNRVDSIMIEALRLQYKADNEGIDSFTTNDICTGGVSRLPGGVTIQDLLERYDEDYSK